MAAQMMQFSGTNFHGLQPNENLVENEQIQFRFFFMIQWASANGHNMAKTKFVVSLQSICRLEKRVDLPNLLPTEND